MACAAREDSFAKAASPAPWARWRSCPWWTGRSGGRARCLVRTVGPSGCGAVRERPDPGAIRLPAAPAARIDCTVAGRPGGAAPRPRGGAPVRLLRSAPARPSGRARVGSPRSAQAGAAGGIGRPGDETGGPARAGAGRNLTGRPGRPRLGPRRLPAAGRTPPPYSTRSAPSPCPERRRLSGPHGDASHPYAVSDLYLSSSAAGLGAPGIGPDRASWPHSWSGPGCPPGRRRSRSLPPPTFRIARDGLSGLPGPGRHPVSGFWPVGASGARAYSRARGL